MAARLSWVTPRRAAGAVALLLAVISVHACVTAEVARRMADFGRAQALPDRIAVTYVRELQLAAPPQVAPVPAAPAAPEPKPRRPRQATPAPAEASASAPAETAASAPGAASAPEEAVPAVADAAADAPALAASDRAAPDPDAAASTDAAASADAAAGAASAAEGVEPFAWPPSTRITYALEGNYRGPVSGDAQVEWIRSGTRYQVHVDLRIGPSAAPLVERRMSSQGALEGAQLVPERYDEQTRAVLRGTRQSTVLLGAEEIVLANGERRPRVGGVQDVASQFIHLAVLFSLQPSLLTVGGLVETIVALPRHVDVWTYEVLGVETLHTPFGPLDTFHLKPRRTSRKASELSAEIWIAPRLRYLPARIVIRQDAETWADLTIVRRPELGAQ